MDEDKASMYIVAIVGVVAAVGILVLLLNVGAVSSEESSDLTGQANIPAGNTCCAWVDWEDGTRHCISSAKVCPRQKL